MTLPTHGRYDYVPINARPDFHWPDGKRLAVYLALNLEHFALVKGWVRSWRRAARRPTC
jgi:hypothetical protein